MSQLKKQSIPNRVINHVAISAHDVETVVQWYSDVFGFRLIGEIDHIRRSERPNAAIFGIYPSLLNEVKLAWLTTGNGVGFEIFEFIDPKPQPQGQGFEADFNKPGYFHIAITDSDPNKLAEKVVKSGGKKIGDKVDPLGIGVEVQYVADPWGNVVEILNVNFEQLACTPVVDDGSRP